MNTDNKEYSIAVSEVCSSIIIENGKPKLEVKQFGEKDEIRDNINEQVLELNVMTAKETDNIPELPQEALPKINANLENRITEYAIQIKNNRDKEANAFEDR